MYMFVNCSYEGGAWKATTLSDLKLFVNNYFPEAGTSWIHFRGRDYCEDESGLYEAQKVDGRTIKDVSWIL